MRRVIGNLPSIFIGWFLFFLGILAPFASAQSQAPVSKEQNHSATEDRDDYWTPERLKKAKPMELPQPTTPLPPLEVPKDEPDEHTPSVQGSGNTGEGKVEPDEKKRMFKEFPLEENEKFSH